jgi:hypothetical protein
VLLLSSGTLEELLALDWNTGPEQSLLSFVAAAHDE